MIKAASDSPIEDSSRESSLATGNPGSEKEQLELDAAHTFRKASGGLQGPRE